MKRVFDKATEDELKYIHESHKKYDPVVVVLLDHDKGLWQPVIEEVEKRPSFISTFTVNGFLIIPFKIVGNRMISIKKEV